MWFKSRGTIKGEPQAIKTSCGFKRVDDAFSKMFVGCLAENFRSPYDMGFVPSCRPCYPCPFAVMEGMDSSRRSPASITPLPTLAKLWQVKRHDNLLPVTPELPIPMYQDVHMLRVFPLPFVCVVMHKLTELAFHEREISSN